MNKIKNIKLYVSILISTIIIGITICANAAWRFTPDGKGYYSTTHNGNDLVFCVELGGKLKNTLKDNLPQFYNNKEYFCNDCKDADWRPSAGTDSNGEDTKIGYTSEMEDATVVDYKEHQDVAYALAYATGDDAQEKIQTVIWKSTLDASGGSDEAAITASHSGSVKYVDDEGLAEEAQAYKKFYEEKEAAGGFKPTDGTNYDEVKVVVNQEDDTYIVGKYNVNYTKGIYKTADKVVKFGYITKIVAKNQDGEELEIVDILAADGTSIMSRTDYPFPDSEEDFYIKFKYDGTGKTTSVGINVEFKYLDECQASMVKWTGKLYQWGYIKIYVEPSTPHKKNCTWHAAVYDDDNNLVSSGYYSHENCHYSSNTHHNAYYYELKKAPYGSELTTEAAQDLLTVEPMGDEGKFAKPIWKDASLYGDFGPTTNITMDFAGIVFLDIPGEKDTTKVNGIYDEGYDKLLPDVEVTLYEQDGTLATLEQVEGEIRTNPTLTDEKGHYEFKGLNAQKKYYVTYKINGQYLESTKYTANVEEYNSDNWNKSSMASILDADRTAYNTKFENINSAPANYTQINNITGFGLTENKTYNIYEQSYDKAQQEADDIETLQNKITEKIRNYISTNKKYPDDSAKTTIYQQVANENSNISEVKNKIQYIVDIEVIAKTGKDNTMEYYPVYDKFVIDNKALTIGSETYPAIYEGQRHINLGVIEREKFDLKIAKDIYQVKVTINNKEYTYKYNGRNQEAVEVELRGSDIPAYERDIRESDIQYIDYINNDEKKLRVYITYKLRITNQSDSFITGYVTALNDYYDADYTYLSSHIVRYNTEGIESDNTLNWNNDTTNHKLTTNDSALSSIPVGISEYFDVFNEFEVNTDALKRLLTENESTKENYAEIAGYKTYYTKQRKFDNDDIINEAGYVAGLVDRDSRPGDFEVTDEVKEFVNYSYTDEFKSKGGEEKTALSLTYFQDDADKAPGLKLILLEIMRELNGNVWEDSTLSQILEDENIRRGDGVNNDNHAIQGMKVELISMDEELASTTYPYNHTNYNRVSDIYNINTKQFETAVTYTAADGSYQFKGYIPGDYLIRYTYGEGNTLTVDSNGKVYNGQDYKSTLYAEENHTIGNNENPNYWYNAENDNKSDAHDNYSLRNTINGKTATMNNHIATVLDYQTDSANADSSKLAELQENTEMFAETNKLILEVEFAKRESSYTQNVQEYKVNNIDFGITERPRSELTLIKDVANIRIIANSGQTIFDAEDKTTNLSWLKPSTVPYSEQHGYAQATMDENLLHGATIKILYNFTIKNTGEKDYVDENGNIDINFYNTGVATGELATTRASYIVDYIENNLKFNPDAQLDNIDKDKGYNQFWTEITDKGELNSGDNNRLVNIDMSILNAYTTIIKATDNSPLLQELKPADKREADGESATTTLLLTKVLNTDSDSTDNLTYNNAAEVVKTENKVGRRSYNNKDRSDYTTDSIADTVKSIPGNYDPTAVATVTDADLQGKDAPVAEPDTDLAETVSVLPPFGEENKVPFILGTILAVIVLAGGIFLIKKKVIK